MLGHYLAAALRGFRRRPLGAVIKLLALALGFACFLTANMIATYVGRADAQWANAGRIYSIAQAVTAPDADAEASATIGAVSTPAVEYLKTDFPDLTVAATNTITLTFTADGAQTDLTTLAVDPAFLRIFDLRVRGGAGDAEALLTAPGAILMEENAARQIFGAAEPVGRTLSWSTGQARTDVTVAGTFAWPSPSHFGAGGAGKNAQVLIARDALLQNFSQGPADRNWSATCCTTYALLPADGSRAEVQARLERFSETRVPPEFGRVRFALMPVGEMGQAYLNLGLFGGSMDLSLVTILNLFAALVLGVACLDFANLATAEVSARAREIGVRKTVGAGRAQIAVQAMTEALLLTLAALAVVLPLTLLIVTPLSAAIRLEIGAADLLGRPGYWLGVLGVTLAVCLAAGAYPALLLARVRPVLSLRMTGSRGGGGAVRAALIVAQFAAASFLLAAMTVMLAQKAELRGRLTDPRQDPRLTLNMGLTGFDEDGRASIEAMMTELRNHPSITGVSASSQEPFRRARVTGLPPATIARSEDPGAARMPIQERYVYFDYFDVAGIPLLAGRDFDADMDATPPGTSLFSFPPGGGDLVRNPTAPPQPVIIDVNAAARMGLTPEQAVGELLYQPVEISTMRDNQPPRLVTIVMPYAVIGVAAAAPLEYMVEGPDDYVYRLQPGATSTVLLRVARGDVPGALAHIDAVWARFFPARPAQRVFLDEAFDTNFAAFNMLGVVFVALSAIAILIAALGLFGMASFVVQRRLREIGVRKALGASTPRVLGLLLWDFSLPVIVANVVAWPLVYLAARIYLNLFVARTALTPLPFAVALAASLLIAWAAVGVHAVRAARVKPALVLKTE